MTDDIAIPIVDTGLGNSSYLVDLGDGRALAVDACLDLRGMRADSERRGLRVAFAADTHLHADFLSGSVQLAASDGACVLASASGRRDFDHVGLGDQDEVDLGGLLLRALTTPGHTDEHLAYLLLDGDRAVGVFTGGSLIVGSAARTDLVAAERAEELARAQYRSLHRLAALPDEVLVWPTHGAGSFCSAGAVRAGAVSTIGAERAANPLLDAPDEDAFVAMLLGSLGSFPSYFLRVGEENRRGPQVLPSRLRMTLMDPAEVRAACAGGGQIIDVRPAASFAEAHPRGALSIPLRPAFASWLGWLAPHDRPLVVLREPEQDPDEVLWQAAKIDYRNIVGELGGGIGSWVAAGLPTESLSLVQATPTNDMRVLDIRQRAEFQAGHVPGAVHIELGDIHVRLDELNKSGQTPTVIMCGHGERAMSAASLLARAGFSDLRVLKGGPEDWVKANGQTLETYG